MNILEDLSAFYKLRISNTKAFVEVLGQLINTLNNFTIITKDTMQEKMQQVKHDISVLTQYSSFVDKAKADYISIRQKQIELEKKDEAVDV